MNFSTHVKVRDLAWTSWTRPLRVRHYSLFTDRIFKKDLSRPGNILDAT